MKTEVFRYPSVLESEGRMYRDVKNLLIDAGISGQMIPKVLLAVSEAFTNALEHGNTFDPDKTIEISIGINNEVVTADIIDEGTADVEIVNMRKPSDSLQEGGRGVDLMKSIADLIEIKRNTGTTGLRVSMKFERNKYKDNQELKCNSEAKMEFSKRDEGSVMVITLSGRLDLSSGGILKEEIKSILTSGKTSVHLNLRNVEFVNSSGLGALVSIMKEIRIYRGRLTLSDLMDYVQEIFDITQLSHIFEIFTTEEEALKSYQAVVCS